MGRFRNCFYFEFYHPYPKWLIPIVDFLAISFPIFNTSALVSVLAVSLLLAYCFLRLLRPNHLELEQRIDFYLLPLFTYLKLSVILFLSSFSLSFL
jgi:hypothetical protein